MEQEINGIVHKINDEDYEIIKIIEKDGSFKAIEWYQENYDCSPKEAYEVIKTIREKYNVKYDGVDVDSEALKWLKEGVRLQAVKVYVEKYGLSLDEAKRYVDEMGGGITANEEDNGNTNIGGSGCVITILIAITSTLSLFWFI